MLIDRENQTSRFKSFFIKSYFNQLAKTEEAINSFNCSLQGNINPDIPFVEIPSEILALQKGLNRITQIANLITSGGDPVKFNSYLVKASQKK